MKRFLLLFGIMRKNFLCGLRPLSEDAMTVVLKSNLGGKTLISKKETEVSQCQTTTGEQYSDPNWRAGKPVGRLITLSITVQRYVDMSDCIEYMDKKNMVNVLSSFLLSFMGRWREADVHFRLHA